jgi:hypothetical protein
VSGRRRWPVGLGSIAIVALLLVIAWPRGDEPKLRELPPMRLTGVPIPPRIQGVPIRSLSLEPRAAGPRWVVKLPDGTARIADPGTGLLLPPLSAVDAVREASAHYDGAATVRSVSRAGSKWRVTMADGTAVGVDASGEVAPRRRSRWPF